MKTEQDALLADIVGDGAQAESLARVLRLARHRRLARRLRRGSAIVAAVAVLGALSWRSAQVERPYQLIRTGAQPRVPAVSTLSSVETASTAPGNSVAIVETGSVSGQVSVIGDDELLSRFASEGAVLVRTGPDEQELVLSEPEAE